MSPPYKDITLPALAPLCTTLPLTVKEPADAISVLAASALERTSPFTVTLFVPSTIVSLISKLPISRLFPLFVTLPTAIVGACTRISPPLFVTSIQAVPWAVLTVPCFTISVNSFNLFVNTPSHLSAPAPKSKLPVVSENVLSAPMALKSKPFAKFVLPAILIFKFPLFTNDALSESPPDTVKLAPVIFIVPPFESFLIVPVTAILPVALTVIPLLLEL